MKLTSTNNLSVNSTLLFQQLESARKQLLDLTLKNRLLNYGWDKNSRGIKFEQGVETNFLSNIFHQLLDDEAIDFVSIDIEIKPKHNHVFTAFTADSLHKRLTKLAYEAKTFEQEQGINILYIAFGFLEWYEAEHSNRSLLAPLLLVPVNLKRKKDGGYTCSCSQEEVENNPSLKQKLQDEFGLSLPDWQQPKESEQLAQSLIEYRVGIENMLRQRPSFSRWNVQPQRAVLDKFSFAKLAMYHDLNPNKMSGSGLATVEALLSGNGVLYDSGANVKEIDINELTADELDNVVEADSSQMQAIRTALQGHHLIIQGPPGTGKSQTIANLIASAVRQGKKVLFVAEKMAALDVVKRRLDNIGLGQVCLELHSHKARPKAVVVELEKTLRANSMQIADYNGDLNRLIASRQALQTYYHQLTEPIAETGYTPYRAIGEQNQLLNRCKGIAPQLIGGIKDVHSWTAEQITDRMTVLQEACRRVKEYGPARQSPFYGSESPYFSQQDLMEIGGLLNRLIGTLQTFQAIKGKFAQFSNVAPEVQTINDLTNANSELGVLSGRPSLAGIDNLTNPDWANIEKTVNQLFLSAHQLHQRQAYVQEQFVPNSLTINLYPIRQAYQAHSGKWYKRFISDFTKNQKALQVVCKNELPKAIATQIALIDTLIVYQEATQQLEKELPRIRQFIPGAATDEFGWLDTETACRYISTVHQKIKDGRINKWVIYHLSNDLEEYQQLLSTLSKALNQWQEYLPVFYQLSGFPKDDKYMLAYSKIPVATLIKQFECMTAWVNKLPNLGSWNASKENLKKLGLDVLISHLESESVDPDQIYDSFCYTFYTALSDYARQSRPQLHQLNSTELKHTTTQYSQLERTLLEINRARVMQTFLSEKPSQTIGGKSIGEMAILKQQIEKPKLAIRELFTKAGQAIQALKPVIMMSPLSIARNLEQQAMQFDLVIFDEASQVKPIDAFGALLRAKQAVVVGDKQQMPPSNYFDKSVSDEEITDEEDTGDQFAQETESILQLFAGRNVRSTMLQWHYRSRHDSLIQVSNHFFYDDELIVVPSPVRKTDNLGLHLRRVPSIYQPKVGNDLEADAIVSAVAEHARSHPDKTLGVVALNMAQMDCIENKMEKLRLTDPELDSFMSAHPHEPFFVKNLESVQGDERDIIFVSVGFGRQKDNSLHMKFGPVNAEGGHRRLNVLFTRAKEQCIIFTGLASSDIRLSADDAGKQQGLRVLKEFLQFAETGTLSVTHSVGSGTESPFEEAVKQIMEQAGYTIDTQIGASGFRIDLGVRDPAFPNETRYLAGIECDGATYHRSRIARDRDHVRQQILEGMGWHIYRIWSTDWFNNSVAETRKLLEHLEVIKAQRLIKPTIIEPDPCSIPTFITIVNEPQEIIADSSISIPYKSATLPYRKAINGLDKESDYKLIEIARQLMETEGPAHIEYIMKRIGDAYCVSRIGSRIEDHLLSAFKFAIARKGIIQDGTFLWLATPSLNVQIRSREFMNDSLRKIEWVPPQEIQATMLAILKQNYAAESQELMQATIKILGFQKLTEKVKEIVKPNIQSLVHENLIQDDGSRIKLVTP